MRSSVGDVAWPARPLNWSRTVAREMVHRSSVAEVLLTDVRRDGADRFQAAASWPRSHVTFPRDGADLHSPLVVVETLRQLGIYVPLRYFGVSPTAHLLITDLYFTLEPGAEPRAESGCTDVTCRIAVSEVRRGAGGGATGMRLDVRYLAAGRTFARAGGGARFLSESRYGALRGDRLSARLTGPPLDGAGRPDPGGLAVGGPRDVVIAREAGGPRDMAAAPGPGMWSVAPADPLHPFFFDHATDHVPGMVLLEAARQAASEASDGRLLRPTAGRLVAGRFTEFAPAARVESVPHDMTCVFRIRQGGECTAYGVLGYPRHATSHGVLA
ncbi:ScbA/BarX family gamma-butyrolactone biosynthesis protein [Streptomyces sp. CA-111067]|uniref:ScbA/BarX family gamma-butyrolactone biosynthesis protein n=1 Tax=Streptomyces sp. CA-111067 TaxID=3240046 RepID=UPI003D996F2A